LGLGLAALGVAASLWGALTLPAFSLAWTAAVFFGLLAVLEYVNYYHVQLNHFDNAADFRRLLSGKGFRKPHLARLVESGR
jgi:hypothetical protein